MKIINLSTQFYTKNLTSFREKPNLNKKVEADNRTMAYGIVGALTLGGIAFCAIKKYNANKIFDIGFKESIVQALRGENINVSAKDLKSVVGPKEFGELVKKFKPEHYQTGLQTASSDIPLEKFYQNSINGNFRVSLHTHSNFSDGKATVEEFLECARKYADKVAKLNKNDDLPPFTIALTDHDGVDGCKEIIKLIAKAPEKYKNLKFVSGCEFSVKNNDKFHDITGLALNPFDNNLTKMLDELKAKRQLTVNNFLEEENKKHNSKIIMEDLIDFENQYYISKGKDGKQCLKNTSGVVFVRHAIKFYYKILGKDVNTEILNTLDKKDVLPIETVVNAINNNCGYASLTHPLKSFWSYIGDNELLRIKNLGVNGIEVNHQYTPSKIIEIGEKSKISSNPNEALKILTEQYKKFAEKSNMFLSGGTDCHEKQIFSREPKINKEFLDKYLLN